MVCSMSHKLTVGLSVAGEAAAAQAEFPHHADRAVRSFHEREGQHGGTRGRHGTGGNFKEARRHLDAETD